MDKLFNSNWILRITALVLAILMFLYVKAALNDRPDSTSNSQEAIISQVPLEVYYDTENLIVTGLPKTVDVTIEGPTPIVIETKLKKDFKVFVDLNSLLIGRHTVTIQDENFSEKLEVSIDPKVVDVIIEEKVTAELKVDPEMNSRLISEAFELDGISVNPTTVFVTGAKSVVESISYVKATVTGKEGINTSFEQEANVKVLDSNLTKLEVSIEPETVNVKVGLKEYSRDLPIRIQQTGTPKEGVTINTLTSSSQMVKVFGPKSIIDSLTELVVEFDVSEIEESGSYDADLVMPNGAMKLSFQKIEIQANVTKEVEETEEPNTQPTEETTPETTVEEPNTDVENTNEQP